MTRKLLISLLFIPTFLYAATSENFEISQENIGGVEISASSSNYQFKAFVGEFISAFSSSTNYFIDQGRTWVSSVTGSGSSTVTILYSVPEGRTGVVGTNDDSVFYITIRTAADTDDVVLFTSSLATTSADGSYVSGIVLAGIATGTYDIGIKGNQHLTRILQDVPVALGTTTLNFSAEDYASTTRGSVEMLAGDVSGVGLTPGTLGDDVVNSVDVSSILAVLDDVDVSGNNLRPNLNQDTAVNSVDLSLMLDNLDLEGDN